MLHLGKSGRASDLRQNEAPAPGRASSTMSLLATAAATAIAAASAAAALASFFAYLHFAARSEVHAAREEAQALADTRGEIIVELEGRLETLEERLRMMDVDY